MLYRSNQPWREDFFYLHLLWRMSFNVRYNSITKSRENLSKGSSSHAFKEVSQNPNALKMTLDLSVFTLITPL
jgi:hypothetical protein